MFALSRAGDFMVGSKLMKAVVAFLDRPTRDSGSQDTKPPKDHDIFRLAFLQPFSNGTATSADSARQLDLMRSILESEHAMYIIRADFSLFPKNSRGELLNLYNHLLVCGGRIIFLDFLQWHSQLQSPCQSSIEH